MAPPKTKRLFISYRSSDAAKVDKIALDLALLRFDDGTARYVPWQDKHNLPPASPNWWDAIVDAIIECDVFVFNLSRDSLQSEVCRAELAYAHKRNRPIIPVVLEGEFLLNAQSGKYDLPKEVWKLVPDWLGEQQFLFYAGTEFYSKFDEAVAQYERHWPHDIVAPRPLNPDNKSVLSSNHALYAAARDYAYRLAFTDAEKHFDSLVRRNDPLYADMAADWLERIRLYAELIEMEEQHSPMKVFKERWAVYEALPTEYLDGESFDPKGLESRIQATPAASTAVSGLVPRRSIQPVWIAGVVAVVLVVAILASFALRGNSNGPTPTASTSTTGAPQIAQASTSTISLVPPTAPLITPSITTISTSSPTPSGTPSSTPNLTLTGVIVAKTKAQVTANAIASSSKTFTPTEIDTPTNTSTFTNTPTPTLAPTFTYASKPVVISLANTDRVVALKTLSGHTDEVTGVAFSPDGNFLATASYDRTVRLWDVKTGQTIKILAGHTDHVENVAFSPDGNFLASASVDRTVRLWDVKTGQTVKTLTGHLNTVESVAFSPDGNILASASYDNTVRLWDVKTGQTIKILAGQTARVVSVAFSPDGSLLAYAVADATVRLWDVKTGQSVKTLKGHTEWIWDVTFSRDGNFLASASYDNTVRLWDVKSAQSVKILTGHTAEVNGAAFSSDGSLLASASDDTTVRIWDVKTGQTVKTLQNINSLVNGLAYSRDGTLIASTYAAETVILWGIQDGK